jgi:hypothetical protein
MKLIKAVKQGSAEITEQCTYMFKILTFPLLLYTKTKSSQRYQTKFSIFSYYVSRNSYALLRLQFDGMIIIKLPMVTYSSGTAVAQAV